MTKVKGYVLDGPFAVAGGGGCEWTTATKDGDRVFIKRFLQPKKPTKAFKGSPALKRKKQQRCKAFEDLHRGVMKALESKVKSVGNLVAPLDFFECDGAYYKVSPLVAPEAFAPEEAAKLPLRERLLLVTSIAAALRALHEIRVVHNDLKPDNILVSMTAGGARTAKLIDFDSSFFSGSPPPVEDFVGDLYFVSPEVVRYYNDSAKPDELTTSVDVFSFALLACQFLTGKVPTYDVHRWRYAGVALANGANLSLPPAGDVAVPTVALLQRSLDLDPGRRPTMVEWHEHLRDQLTGKAPSPPVPAPAGPGSTSKLTINRKGRERDAGAAPAVNPEAPAKKPGLTINRKR